MKKVPCLMFIAASAIFAQAPPINYENTQCGVRVVGKVYFRVVGQVPGYGTCLAIGPNLKISNVNNQWTVDVDMEKLTAALVPQLVTQIIPLLPTPPPSTSTQPKLVASPYFDIVTIPATNEVQVYPSVFFGRYIRVEQTSIPPSSTAKCAQSDTGETQPAYERLTVGSVLLSTTFRGEEMYFCTLGKVWRKVSLVTF